MKNHHTPELNALTFTWPENKTAFYFTEYEIEKSRELHFSQYPNDIESLFPGISKDATRKLYTTYDYKTEEGKILKIDFRNENTNLLKRFYNNRIFYYFRKCRNQLVMTDFVKDNQIWLPLPLLSNTQYDVYEKYTLKVQFCQLSMYPELLVSYDGESKVLRTSVAELIQDVNPQLVNRVYFNNRLFYYDELVKKGFDRFTEARPVLNKDIEKALGYAYLLPPKENTYLKHYRKIRSFIDSLLDNATFRALIPLHSTQFLSVNPVKVSNTNPGSNQLLFAGKQTSVVPYMGMRDFGPFKPPKWKNIHLFYIFHKDNQNLTTDLHSMLFEGQANYGGLKAFAKVNPFVQKNFSISFSNKLNPVPEIEHQLRERTFEPDVRYIAIYISPWEKTEPDQDKRKIYFHLKELLLKHNITSQAIDAEKIRHRNGYFHYSLTNIALAMLAKLDGIPWRLNSPVKNELIIGVGAFKHTDTQVNYIGSAFSFDNNGGFNNFEYFLKHETNLLAGSIADSVRRYVTLNQHIERLIIHFYKKMSNKELQPIEDALQQLNLDIPVFIVSINKTESKSLIGFDTSWPGLMPTSGTYINIGRHQYLLFNNTRYRKQPIKESDGFPFPVKLSIDCNQKQLLEQHQISGELIEQVYQFSRLYYKSVRQQGLPITIKYPEILAGIGPNFVNDAIPVFGKDNLWFL